MSSSLQSAPRPVSAPVRDEPTEAKAPAAAEASYVTPAVYALVALTLILIPLRIIAQGFMPDDDALVDAAKAITGRAWTDVLVLRPQYTLDPHVGWHSFLHAMSTATGFGQHSLVAFAVIALFALFTLSALPWLKRPE